MSHTHANKPAPLKPIPFKPVDRNTNTKKCISNFKCRNMLRCNKLTDRRHWRCLSFFKFIRPKRRIETLPLLCPIKTWETQMNPNHSNLTARLAAWWSLPSPARFKRRGECVQNVLIKHGKKFCSPSISAMNCYASSCCERLTACMPR